MAFDNSYKKAKSSYEQLERENESLFIFEQMGKQTRGQVPGWNEW